MSFVNIQVVMFIFMNILLYWVSQSALRLWRWVSWISSFPSVSKCCALSSSCQAVLCIRMLSVIATCLSLLVISALGWLVWVKGLKETKQSSCKHWEGLRTDIPAIYITSFIDHIMVIAHLIHVCDTLDVIRGTEASYPARVHVHRCIHEDAAISIQYFVVSSSLFLIHHSVI
jgi:hypothetical protein